MVIILLQHCLRRMVQLLALQRVERGTIIAGNHDDEEDGNDAFQYQL